MKKLKLVLVMVLVGIVGESKPAISDRTTNYYEYEDTLKVNEQWNNDLYSTREQTLQEKFDSLFGPKGKESAIRTSTLAKMKPLVKEVDQKIKLMESLRTSMSAREVSYVTSLVVEFNALLITIDELLKQAEEAKKPFFAALSQKRKITDTVQAIDAELMKLTEDKGKIESAVDMLLGNRQALVEERQRAAREVEQQRFNEAERKRMQDLEAQFKKFLIETRNSLKEQDYSKLPDHEQDALVLSNGASPETQRRIAERLDEVRTKAEAAKAKQAAREEETYGYSSLRHHEEEPFYGNVPHRSESPKVVLEPIHAALRPR